jgi:RNA polymerase sigma factor (sigma-70 family)
MPSSGITMTTSQMSEVIQLFRGSLLICDGAGMTDAQLLERFINERDEAAFTAIVRRHGSMVWGVCRRILPGHQDAEDAFQATFVVLVCRAASVFPPEMVANWLYGVAHRTALKARAAAARRKARERQVAEMPEPAVDERDLWSDLRPVLDRELSRLPDMYRSAIVLCDLEGKTRKQAAEQLDIPEGTLSARLTRGRALLAKRLSKHGVAVSAAVFAPVVSVKVASAYVPTSVMCSTIKAAGLFAAGQMAAAGAVSTDVASLVNGVTRTMLLTRAKVAQVVILAASLLVGWAPSIGSPAHQAKVDVDVQNNNTHKAVALGAEIDRIDGLRREIDKSLAIADQSVTGHTPARRGKPDAPAGSGKPDVSAERGKPDVPAGSGKPDVPAGSAKTDVSNGNESGKSDVPVGRAKPDDSNGNG